MTIRRFILFKAFLLALVAVFFDVNNHGNIIYTELNKTSSEQLFLNVSKKYLLLVPYFSNKKSNFSYIKLSLNEAIGFIAIIVEKYCCGEVMHYKVVDKFLNKLLKVKKRNHYPCSSEDDIGFPIIFTIANQDYYGSKKKSEISELFKEDMTGNNELLPRYCSLPFAQFKFVSHGSSLNKFTAVKLREQKKLFISQLNSAKNNLIPIIVPFHHYPITSNIFYYEEKSRKTRTECTLIMKRIGVVMPALDIYERSLKNRITHVASYSFDGNNNYPPPPYM